MYQSAGKLNKAKQTNFERVNTGHTNWNRFSARLPRQNTETNTNYILFDQEATINAANTILDNIDLQLLVSLLQEHLQTPGLSQHGGIDALLGKFNGNHDENEDHTQ